MSSSDKGANVRAPISYIYVGDGAGVPGLPHEISEREAKNLGLLELLRQAVRLGQYAERTAAEPRESE